MELSDHLKCLFSGEVTELDGSYVVEIPHREIDRGDIAIGEIYRIAMLAQSPEPATRPAPSRESHPEPPVAQGEQVEVEIEDVGDQGDGIARVGPGYVVIVPDTELGERVAVEITEVRANMAFANVVERHDRMR